MADYSDCTWSSADGLTLHYRDYPGRVDRPVVVCLHGLTRNARDFEPLASRLAGEWRVVCPELRGRGESQYARDWGTYTPAHYVVDLIRLLEQPGFERMILVGTSLGGLLAMLLSNAIGSRIVATAINDVGPVLEKAGLDRIGEYVGQGRSFPTWMHAARAIQETQGLAYPDFDLPDWLAMAKRLMTLSSNRRIVFDYDMQIAKAFHADRGAAPDLWPAFQGLSGRPNLLLRGELSDILSEATFAEMARRLPGAEAVTVARTGHAPILDEPEAAAAIDGLLARVG